MVFFPDDCEDSDEEPEKNILGDEEDDFDDPEEDLIDGVGFADPGGESALRAATPRNPRNRPCPTCGEPNRLTPLDVANHYICDQCADQAEGRMGGKY
jgi:hypothetical protein